MTTPRTPQTNISSPFRLGGLGGSRFFPMTPQRYRSYAADDDHEKHDDDFDFDFDFDYDDDDDYDYDYYYDYDYDYDYDCDCDGDGDGDGDYGLDENNDPSMVLDHIVVRTRMCVYVCTFLCVSFSSCLCFPEVFPHPSLRTNRKLSKRSGIFNRGLFGIQNKMRMSTRCNQSQLLMF